MSNSPAVVTQITTHLALDPADWEVATWRPRSPRPRPAAAPFDRAGCVARLGRVGGLNVSFGPADWGRAGISAVLSREEAHFWLLAMTDPARHLAQQPTGEISLAEVRQRLRQRAGFLPPQVMTALASLFSPAELIELLLDDQLAAVDAYLPHYQVSALQHVLVDGFRQHVRPWLTDAELAQMRDIARSRLPSSLWTQSAAPSVEQAVGYRLAPLLNMHRELASLVAGWPDDLFPKHGSYEEWRRSPREMVFGLGDPWLVEQHTRRLRLLLRSDQDARAWLAHTETRALDWLSESIRATPGYVAARLTEGLCLVRSPAAVKELLQLRLAGQSNPALSAWFEQQVGNAVAGLLPLAAGRGKVADSARRFLRDIRRRGHRGVIEEQLASTDAAVARRIRSSILDVEEIDYPPMDESSFPPWLRQAMMQLPPLPRGELPGWLMLDDLPPLVVDGRRLGPGQVRTVVRAIEACKLNAPAILLTALRNHAEPASREAFAWGIVEQRQSAGGAWSGDWPLNAVGFLGGDESVLRLLALIREGTGAAGRRGAMQALECLTAIGSSLALQQLNALARQARSRQVRQHARHLVDDLARVRGLSRGELEDWAVPALGFDGDRGPVFDFGPRQFQAALVPGPRLLLRDGSGGVRDDLPAPAARDDAPRARQALAEWRLLRKTVKEVFKEQAARLERAMVSGQRWSARHFRDRVLGQPLLVQLARLVLWGGYDDRGRLASTFRVTDESRFADADENPLSLADINSVRVVHPIELTEELRERWSMAWRDHELVTPFPQLGRRLFPLRDEERGATAITRYRGRRVAALTLAGLVSGRDWVPVVIGSGRSGEAHLKVFPTWAVTAVLHHRNVGPFAYPDHRAEQELSAAYFFHGTLDVDTPIDPASAVTLGEVHDLPRSEVEELMAQLHAKGKE